jgi:UDP-N-acetylglucosamine--N-acetylmuramyl-(pentapeptide) pyrophosphoryl-undecaprenol N-acetylglucosamine transferase
VHALRRRGALAWLLLPVTLALAMAQALRILRRQRPRVVLAMGGFVAGPGAFVAWLLRKRLLIHEQNAAPGLTNRWLALIADQVLCGFPGAFRRVPSARHVGNPVRADITALPPPRRDFAETSTLCLLVLGGSQGAQVFNTVVPEALRAWDREPAAEVWHQCGGKWVAPTRAAYAGLTVSARVTGFIDDMAAAYHWADLVICRAGAMTVAELCAAGRAAILVPYPHAVDRHQTVNANFLAEREAAILLPQERFVASVVCELLERVAANRELLIKMAQNARRCAMPDAAETIGELCLEAMHA